MKLAVYGRSLEKANIFCIKELMEYSKVLNISLVFHADFLLNVRAQVNLREDYLTFTKSSEIQDSDFVLSFGGDGTLLDVVTLIKDSNIPVVGINTGRLGFLTSTGKGDIKRLLDALLENDFKIDNRSLIQINSNMSLFKDAPIALNEFAIHKKDVSSLIVVHTYIDGVFLNSFWADGLIVSTPTGSTAYNLSCGGPIVFPNSNNFIINPVAPHNLTQRPIVVSDSCEISFEIEGRTNQFLCTMDSRIETVDSEVQIKLRKADYYLGIVRLNEDDFMTTLRNKMMWGLDKRN